jgi:positive regulator of sigma E activity
MKFPIPEYAMALFSEFVIYIFPLLFIYFVYLFMDYLTTLSVAQNV